MPIVVTQPGKLGDLIWSLATVKRLTEIHETRAILITTTYCQNAVPFIKAQPYIKDVIVAGGWKITGDCPGNQPWMPPPSTLMQRYGEWTFRPQSPRETFHLGFPEWPSPTLLEDPARRHGVILGASEPWLTLPNRSDQTTGVSIAFTDEYAEAKAGITYALIKACRARNRKNRSLNVLLNAGSRMASEFGFTFLPCDFLMAARSIAASKLWVGCKSVWRVVAYGLGIPTLVVEPSPPRWQSVFDPPPVKLWREHIYHGFDAREVVARMDDMFELIEAKSDDREPKA